MSAYRQVFTGLLIAALVGLLLLGAISLSLAEASSSQAPGGPTIQAQTAFPFQPPLTGGSPGPSDRTGQPTTSTLSAQP